MKKKYSSISLVLIFVSLSIILYLLQITFFGRVQDTVFYFLQDIAFLPLQVAIVTVVISKFISIREKRAQTKNMNMAINAFFGEVGTESIQSLNKFMVPEEDIQIDLKISAKWVNKDYQKAVKTIKGYDFPINSKTNDLAELKVFLMSKRNFLLIMLENSNLLEHDTFTDMLWAVFHLTDELVARKSFDSLPETDLNHLTFDMKRAYVALIIEWVNYCSRLKVDYPYLFSMEVRKNPFDANRSIIVKDS
ncbi:MAG: hypothetical protein ACYCYI_14885 [Saccharofermentanales bacterium]